jgi:phosphoglycolate phosphatase-like HAD superfamily hydrolase
MNNWMTQLASHYNGTRDRYPNDRIMIVFDIDGTILDMRYVILHVLKAFDESHNTRHFVDLKVSDIDFHEEHVRSFLDRLHISSEDKEVISEQYKRIFWTSAAALEAHRPFRGVLEVIRWFQMQPNTYVALNTGRPESLRFQTLHTLNRLADEYRVNFDDDLLYMKPDGSELTIPEVKVNGIQHFGREGYRVCAVVDNEPENLYAVSQADPEQGILLLHADTIFKSKRASVPGHAVNGKRYDLTALIVNNTLPQHTQFVWHCTCDTENFHQFIQSNIHWVQFDMRLFSSSLQQTSAGAELPDLAAHLYLIRKYGKKIKFLLHEGGVLLTETLRTISQYGFDDSSTCMDISVVTAMDSESMKILRSEHPRMIIQCPVDFLAPVILDNPVHAKDILTIIHLWGVDRFSVNWMQPKKRQIITQLIQWGFEIDISHVHRLESFLQAVLMAPSSITSHFNFLEYYHEEYPLVRLIA